MNKISKILLTSDAIKELELNWEKLINTGLVNSETLCTCVGVLKEQLNGVWVFVDKKLPTKDEYNYNDGRFIVTDGNKVYQSLFDIYEKHFIDVIYKGNCNFEYVVDNKIIAWQILPKRPYTKK